MQLRQLGDSDLHVSEISLGSWLTYSGGVERDQTEACTRAAFDAGITFFDTSNIYGVGAAETAWGEVLSGFDRSSYVLATKVFFPMSETDSGLSREQIHKQLEAWLEVPGARKWVSSQPQYNLLWRAPEAELIPFCSEHGISQIVWSPLAQGVLAGKYKPGEPPPADSRMASDAMNWAMDRYRSDEVVEAVQRLIPIAEGAGLGMVQMALAWILRQENVASAIIGASRPEQVHANAEASGVEL